MHQYFTYVIFTAIYIPIQVIIIPLQCNRNIPNINFRSHVTLVVNWWLMVHFLHLSIYYSYYSVIALFYRLCCTAWMFVYCYPNQTYHWFKWQSPVWMFLYCYPDQTHNSYHYLKRQLPEWIKLCLRPVRDKLTSKVWQSLRAMINCRRRKGIMVKNLTNLLNVISVLWNVLHYLWVILYTEVKSCSLWLFG